MKRLWKLALALCLALGLCGCDLDIDQSEAGAADDSVLYDHGLELAELLEEMLGSGEYLQLMTTSQEISGVIGPYMRTDFSQPGSAYRITLPEGAVPLLMDAGDVDMDGFSGPLREFLEHRAMTSVPTMLNAQEGSSVLAAASIYTVSNTWAGEALEQDCYLLYFYPQACPIIVTFCGGDGYVEGSAMLLLGDKVAEGSLDEAAEMFGGLGAGDMRVEELEVNQD